MGTPSAIRDGLLTRLETVSGLNGYDTVPGTFNAPGAIVRPMRMTVESMGLAEPTVRYHFEILIAVAISKEFELAQDDLDAYLALSGTNSIAVALYGDRTLGGACDDLQMTGWRDYGPVDIGTVQYLGAIIDVEVLV